MPAPRAASNAALLTADPLLTAHLRLLIGLPARPPLRQAQCNKAIAATRPRPAKAGSVARRAVLPLLALLALLGGCASQRPSAPAPTPVEIQADIASRLPSGVKDAPGWARDIQVALTTQDIAPTAANVCAVIAIIGQESGFQADPAVAGMPKVARAEIDRRAAALHLPALLVDAALDIRSPDGRSYGQRLRGARTEQDLSLIFEDFIGMVPLGNTLFGGLNPVRTAGPMQVSVAFAQAHAQGYPYPATRGIRHETFTRRGGIWFGTRHLLGYPAAYDALIFRFADYNAGWYASRNAAFQAAVSRLTGIPLALDGDLLLEASPDPGETELAVRSLGSRLGLSEAAIRRDLARGNDADFSETAVYRRVFSAADQSAGAALPRGLVPHIKLHGPKITRPLTTAWFAGRVQTRWEQCMNRADKRR